MRELLGTPVMMVLFALIGTLCPSRAVAAEARLVVDTDLACELQVNGMDTGKLEVGQVRNLVVPPGESLVICRAGAQASEQVAAVAEGHQALVRFRWAESDAPPEVLEGELRIEVGPESANVYLDGELLGTGSRVVRVPAGKTVVIQATAEGYETLEERVRILPGNPVSLQLRLQPVAR